LSGGVRLCKSMEAGDVCGGHKLQAELGSGYFSTVFAAHPDLAVKIQRSKYWDEGWDEARLWERLQSTNIVRLHEHFVADLSGKRVAAKRRPKPKQLLRHVFVMPAVRGRDLMHWVDAYAEARRRPPLRLVAAVARDLFRALVVLQEANVLHTDIKPENILVESSATTLDELEEQPLTAMLTDFGCACDDWEKVSDSVCTRQYQPPESILCADYTFSLDVWSAACTVFEFATTQLLFDVRSASACSGDSHDDEVADELDEHHLSLMQSLCGEMPKRLISKGQRSRDFYSARGRLRKVAARERRPLPTQFAALGWPPAESAALCGFLLPLLQLAPSSRQGARETLDSAFLQAFAPPPCPGRVITESGE